MSRFLCETWGFHQPTVIVLQGNDWAAKQPLPDNR